MRDGLRVILGISALGNKLLQDNKLDNRLLTEEPDRCAAIIGAGLNQIGLIASLLTPYMPTTSNAIFEQLGCEPQASIPDAFIVDAIKPGQKLGEPKHLFTQIAATKIDEWKDAFGGEEVRKQKEEAARKAAEKKAAKEREKEKKRLKKEAAKAAAVAEADGAATAPGAGPSVESEEKRLDADPAIEAVTQAIAKTEMHTS